MKSRGPTHPSRCSKNVTVGNGFASRTRPALRRFFAPPAQIEHGWATLEGSEAHHLRVTLRMKSGAEILVLDGEGGAYEGRVEETRKDRIRVRILGRRQADTESALNFGLAQAMIRNEKMKWVLQKATELGVSDIKPFYTPRSVVLSGKDSSKWLERSRRILIEALKQCGRLNLPRLSPPVDFHTLLSEVSATRHGILLWEKPCTPFKEVLEGRTARIRHHARRGPRGRIRHGRGGCGGSHGFGCGPSGIKGAQSGNGRPFSHGGHSVPLRRSWQPASRHWKRFIQYEEGPP